MLRWHARQRRSVTHSLTNHARRNLADMPNAVTAAPNCQLPAKYETRLVYLVMTIWPTISRMHSSLTDAPPRWCMLCMTSYTVWVLIILWIISTTSPGPLSNCNIEESYPGHTSSLQKRITVNKYQKSNESLTVITYKCLQCPQWSNTERLETEAKRVTRRQKGHVNTH